MVWFFATVAAAVVVTCLWVALRTPSEQSRRKRADALATRYFFYVEPGDLDHFDELLDRDRRLHYLGAAFEVTVIAVLVVIDWQSSELPSLGLVAAGLAVFVPLNWAFVLVGTRGRGDATVERASTGDYLHPAARLVMLAAALFGLALASWVAVAPSEYAGRSTVLLALVPLWVLVVSEAMMLLVCRAPIEGATTGLRYAAQAVRSESLIKGYTAPLVVVIIALGQAASDQDAYQLVYVAIALLPALVWVQAKPSRYHLRFRTRLWPQLQPHEIISTSPRWPVSA